jgi:hypothetical protein
VDDDDDPLHGNWYLPWHWTRRQGCAVLLVVSIVCLGILGPILLLLAAFYSVAGLPWPLN